MNNFPNSIPIRQLVDEATKYLSALGYSSVSVHHYSLTWNQLLKYSSKCNVEYFTLDFGMKFLEEMYDIRELAHSSQHQKYIIRKIKVLNDFMLSHSCARHYKINPVIIPSQLSSLYNNYSNHLKYKNQKDKTILIKLSRLKTFFDFLNKMGIIEIGSIKQSVMIDFLSFLNSKYTSSGRSNILYTLRDFLKFSSAINLVPQGLESTFQVIYTNKHERLPSFYSKEEVNRLLDSVDRKTITGRKDYAILLLASQLGMRASDINHLMIDNIKWEKNTIEFVQQKTGVYLQLPLTDEVKFALLDYLKNSRSQTQYKNVFIKQMAPHTPFVNGMTFHPIVSKYMKKAGILTDGKHHGLHSLRHSLASTLLRLKSPIPVISSILGHSSTEVTNRYIWIDIEQLRVAALEVSDER